MVDKVQIGDATLYCGDCLEVLPTLGKVDAVITDPPYGMDWDTDSSRFSGGCSASVLRRGGGMKRDAVVADDQAFDPEPWLYFPEVIMWGCNHYAQRLPKGTTLVWIKRNDNAYGSFLSDAELAWEKNGHGVYCHRDLSKYSAGGREFHPTQKPVGLMQWCVERTKAETILDPFMGSGTTGVACAQMGRKFVGIEIERKYFDIACQRIEQAYAQGQLFPANDNTKQSTDPLPL